MCLAQWLRLRRELPAIHRRYSMKKSVLKNFAIFTGKHLSRSLFNKVEGLKAYDHLFWKTSANGSFWESTVSSYHPVPSGKVFPQVSHLPPSKQRNFNFVDPDLGVEILFSKEYLNPQVRINKMVNVVLIVIPVLQNEPQGYILIFL